MDAGECAAFADPNFILSWSGPRYRCCAQAHIRRERVAQLTDSKRADLSQTQPNLQELRHKLEAQMVYACVF
jgi:hypothetical protein